MTVSRETLSGCGPDDKLSDEVMQMFPSPERDFRL